MLFRFWPTRKDLNLRPSESESDALSSCATGRNIKLNAKVKIALKINPSEFAARGLILQNCTAMYYDKKQLLAWQYTAAGGMRADALSSCATGRNIKLNAKVKIALKINPSEFAAHIF